MKSKLSYAILAATVAVPALFAPTPGFAAANDEAKSGLYFNKNGEKGAYYTFEAWAELTQVEKAMLLNEYGTANVQVLLKAQGFEKITTLGAISDSGKPFLEAATEYKDGDIQGTFVDATTNEDIVIGEVVTPEITAAKIAIGNTIVDFTSLDGATSILDLSALKPTDTATLATLTVSADSELTLEYKSVEKKIELTKGVNSLSAQDLIPGLSGDTPLTVAFLQSISNGENPLNITTTLTDASDKSNTVAGTLTIKIPAN